MKRPDVEPVAEKPLKIDYCVYSAPQESMSFELTGPCVSIDHYQVVQEKVRQFVRDIERSPDDRACCPDEAS